MRENDEKKCRREVQEKRRNQNQKVKESMRSRKYQGKEEMGHFRKKKSRKG